MSRNSPTATKEQVLQWLADEIFVTKNGEVFKGNRRLAQRINFRNGCQHGDPRVDLHHQGVRKSMSVSHLVWMQHARQVIPDGWEIHHRNGDCTNNSWENLVCLHALDHYKEHYNLVDEVPF